MVLAPSATPASVSRTGVAPPGPTPPIRNVTSDLLAELGCAGQISPKGQDVLINHTRRWVVGRTNAWCNRGFNLLVICTERRRAVITAFLALATVIIVRRLVREAWTTHRWDTRPARRP
ncbi:hypothetical protein JNW88_21185 [Micromonospora sp. ATA32]|nr:hypothetical protein [Micromonospora sp. ATA32]